MTDEKLLVDVAAFEAARKAARQAVSKQLYGAFLADKTRKELIGGFTRLTPVFEHFGITVICKGKHNPVWTLRGHGKRATVSSDGAIDLFAGGKAP
jgi:hypothetical protein